MLSQQAALNPDMWVGSSWIIQPQWSIPAKPDQLSTCRIMTRSKWWLFQATTLWVGLLCSNQYKDIGEKTCWSCPVSWACGVVSVLKDADLLAFWPLCHSFQHFTRVGLCASWNMAEIWHVASEARSGNTLWLHSCSLSPSCISYPITMSRRCSGSLWEVLHGENLSYLAESHVWCCLGSRSSRRGQAFRWMQPLLRCWLQLHERPKQESPS